MSDSKCCSNTQQEDEKKSKKKQAPTDDRPPVPAPSEATLKSMYFLFYRESKDYII